MWILSWSSGNTWGRLLSDDPSLGIKFEPSTEISRDEGIASNGDTESSDVSSVMKIDYVTFK